MNAVIIHLIASTVGQHLMSGVTNINLQLACISQAAVRSINMK